MSGFDELMNHPRKWLVIVDQHTNYTVTALCPSHRSRALAKKIQNIGSGGQDNLTCWFSMAKEESDLRKRFRSTGHSLEPKCSPLPHTHVGRKARLVNIFKTGTLCFFSRRPERAYRGEYLGLAALTGPHDPSCWWVRFGGRGYECAIEHLR